MKLVKCIDCIHWESFDEGIGYCLNPQTMEDMTDDTSGCSLGEEE